MPSSLLRTIGLVALAYFIFFVPIGHNKTLAEHGREIWEETQLRHALEKRGRQIKGDVIVRLKQWRDSQQPQGDVPEQAPADADGGIAPAPATPDPEDDTPKRHTARGRHRLRRRAAGQD